MSAASDRVCDFLNARAEMSSIDPERIASIGGRDGLLLLTTSDLWDLLAELEQLRSAGES